MSPSVPRLKRRAQFLRVARSGRRWAAPGLVLQALDRKDDSGDAQAGIVQAGFTVSKKVGNAVRRNRARRRLKAVAEEILPVAGQPGHDYVLIGRAGTLDRAYHALAGDLQAALAKLAAGKGQASRKQRTRKGAAR